MHQRLMVFTIVLGLGVARADGQPLSSGEQAFIHEHLSDLAEVGKAQKIEESRRLSDRAVQRVFGPPLYLITFVGQQGVVGVVAARVGSKLVLIYDGLHQGRSCPELQKIFRVDFRLTNDDVAEALQHALDIIYSHEDKTTFRHEGRRWTFVRGEFTDSIRSGQLWGFVLTTDDSGTITRVEYSQNLDVARAEGQPLPSDERAFIDRHLSDLLKVRAERVSDSAVLRIFALPIYRTGLVMGGEEHASVGTLTGRVGSKLVEVSLDYPEVIQKMLKPGLKPASADVDEALTRARMAEKGQPTSSNEQAFIREHLSDLVKVRPQRLSDRAVLRVFAPAIYRITLEIGGSLQMSNLLARAGNKLVQFPEPRPGADDPGLQRMFRPDFRLTNDDVAETLQRALDLIYRVKGDDDREVESFRHEGRRWTFVRGRFGDKRVGFVLTTDGGGAITGVKYAIDLEP